MLRRAGHDPRYTRATAYDRREDHLDDKGKNVDVIFELLFLKCLCA